MKISICEVGVSDQILTSTNKARKGSSVVPYESHIGRNSDTNESLSVSNFFSVFRRWHKIYEYHGVRD